MRFVSTSYQRRRQQNRRYKEYDKDPAGSLLQLCRYVPSKNGITTTSSTGTGRTSTIAQQKCNNNFSTQDSARGIDCYNYRCNYSPDNQVS